MIFEKLLKIFENVIPEVDPAEIRKESSLVEDLGLNSLTMMLLAVSIEDEFGITFDGSVNFDTVDDVCNYIADETATN